MSRREVLSYPCRVNSSWATARIRSRVLEATQQLSTSLGVAVLGTIFVSAFGHHLPTDALQITAWACLAPLAGAFLFVFRPPMHARDEQELLQQDDGTPSPLPGWAS